MADPASPVYGAHDEVRSKNANSLEREQSALHQAAADEIADRRSGGAKEIAELRKEMAAMKASIPKIGKDGAKVVGDIVSAEGGSAINTDGLYPLEVCVNGRPGILQYRGTPPVEE
jgi:hypothetical protein